jgi:hypothetical protein
MKLDALILTLPTRNSTLRMRAWRALKESGCALLRDGVYVLPADAPTAPVLARMAGEIRAAGGFAMTVELKLKAADAAHVRKLFDRSADYGALVREIGARGASPQRTRRLQRSFARLSAIDFFPGRAQRQAQEALGALQRKAGEPAPSGKGPRQRDASRYRRRVWATRSDPWIDRLASAWLIKRFIDREARFAWIDGARGRPRGAVGFDYDGADFTHTPDRVTFEVLMASFGLERDPALAAIGAAVHFLDVGGIPVPDARGLETVLRGIKEKARDDDALLAEAMRILDLFYSAYARAAKGNAK